ncbi:hypothetical protein GGR39_001874 [Novosphingobium fluoreni]|uniref:Uncharacterized protein n=1 Tax=Novosphingobium fluoreni TaxID=1391222 RepID=A0A7W6FZJ3_9SPHN|nr:hypothetical protein [Novosphingobium fluoreni]
MAALMPSAIHRARRQDGSLFGSGFADAQLLQAISTS